MNPSFLRQPLLWLLTLLVFRFWFAATLPMTGDEAYFVLWGEQPAGGYYDHPPMVGWWLTGLLALSRAEWVLRLPAILLPLVLASGVWWMLRPQGLVRARAGAWLMLLAPVDVWNVLITTDTPVILFTMLSAVAYVGAMRAADDRRRGTSIFWHGMAGALLGLAFLGKYFAALLGFAYLAHVLLARRDAGRCVGFFALLLAALPAPLYNLWWNSEHCWVNILFNFVNRHDAAGLNWQNPLLYLASLAYLATPWLLLALWRYWPAVRQAGYHYSETRTAFWLAAVPLGIFAMMSLGRGVGLHWLVSFIPFLIVLAASALPQATLSRLLRWSAGFAILHAVFFTALMVLPVNTWNKTRLYEGIVLTARPADVLTQLQPLAADHLLAMDSYSSAATLAYHAQRPVAVFGEGSLHARHDDFITDWRTQDGRNILILKKVAPRLDDYRPYFAKVELRELEIHGARFHVVLGTGFRYEPYREQILRRIRDRFYRIPPGLPQRGCEFCERYFPGEVQQ